MSPRILCCIAMICTLFLPVAGTREQVPHGKYVGPCRSLDLSSIPIVVVGTITSDQKVGQPERVTRDHSVAIYQWFKVGVHVENVLKGNIRSRDVDIYYLTNIGPIGGPHRLGLRANVPGGTWRIGDREMFFLWRDEGFLRTICDTSTIAVWRVYTGPHQTSQKPLPEAITDILLDRGLDCTDRDMINAIIRSLPYSLAKDYTIQKLHTIATTGQPSVRKQACDILRSMGQPCSHHMQ